MASPPDCGKCGNAHWRFVSCDDAKTQGAKPKPGPHRSFVQRDGERPYGDRLTTVKRNGDVFHAAEKNSPHGGAVVYPPGFTPPNQED